MPILGASLTECTTPTNLRSTFPKIFVVILFLIIFYVNFIKPSFSLNFIGMDILKQHDTNATSPTQNSSMWTKVLNISRTNFSTKVSSKTGPLYMTAAFMGRLGNQLFIYASLLGIARAQNRTAFIQRGTILESAFEITHVNSSISTAGFKTVREAKYATFDSKLLNLTRENTTLAGYLQVWKYFHSIDECIRRELTFNATLRKPIDAILDKVRGNDKSHVLVGVHVRRGDFLSGRGKKAGYGVPKASYFVKAFARMRSMLNRTNVRFVVASDDLRWCQENLNFTDVRILEPESAVLHFGVLASCDHVILSGGTYGWWAAWLANGITIYYDRFFVNGTELMRGVNLSDYYPPAWINVGD